MISPLRHLILSGLTCLTGCTPLDLMNLASGSAGFRNEEDVAYGDNPRQTLDIYAPKEIHPAGCRIMFVYGGSWREGDKRDYGFVGAAFARHGHEVVIPDYRLYPEVTFPGFAQDIALSLSWYQKREDPRPLVLMGHSAGGLIAGLVAYDRQFLEAEGAEREDIAALVTLAAPHDYFLPTEEKRWTQIFGTDPQQQVKALPVRHVTENAPPTLILHGAGDEIVTPRSASSLSSALADHGVTYDTHLYAGVGHRRIMASIAPPLQFLSPGMGDILRFLHENVCAPAS